MKEKTSQRLKLKSFGFDERMNDDPDYTLSPFEVDDFSLLIGDNAQGKTRLFRTLKFLQELFSGKARSIATSFHATFDFVLLQNNNSAHTIKYELLIIPQGGTNLYKETVQKDDQVILDSDKKLLFNEAKNTKLDSYFTPKNIPAIVSISEEDFTSIKLIREFFQRMLFIDATKQSAIQIDTNATKPNSEGTNIASVLENWKNKYPHAFNETVNDFRRCFTFVSEMHLEATSLQNGLIANILAIREKNVKRAIPQMNWSDGFNRVLCLIAMPKTVFESPGGLQPPSFICIDEIENGLDYKTLEYMIKYLRDYSDEMQIMLTSHSPLISDFVHPRHWKVVKRSGAKVNVHSPELVEEDIDKQLELFKYRNWDFYTKHVSNSKLYQVK